MRYVLVAAVWSFVGFAQAQPVAEPPPPAPAESGGGTGLEDIVVTARKRSEQLGEVPASVTAITGNRLDDIQARSLEDYAALIPGLQIQQGGRGAGTLALRGINTGREPSQLVGVLLDGVPYGSTGTFAFAGISQLDASTWDLDRIEVLRGPQGTLYGAGAFGGIVAYYYNQPNLDENSARIETEASSTFNANHPNYAERGVGNLVIIPGQLAARVSVSEEDFAGFIDDRLLGRKSLNDNNVLNIHGSVLLAINDRWSFRLDGLGQRLNHDALDDVIYGRLSREPVAGGLAQDRLVPEKQDLRDYQGSGTLTGDLGFATLTAITSYSNIKTIATSDLSDSLVHAALARIPFIGRLIGATQVDVNVPVNKVVEEVRLASAAAGPFTWLVGGFFTKELAQNDQRYSARLINNLRFPLLDPFQTLLLDSQYREYAFFGDLTYDIADDLRVEGGLRYSDNGQRYVQTTNGVAGPVGKTDQNRIDYAATLRYQIERNDYAYARFATGYRAGGPNVALPGAPTSFAPDTIDNYEIGYKSRWLDDRLAFDATFFYIDWNRIQLTTSVGGLSYRANGGQASSRGVETSVTFAVTPRLIVGGSLAYTDSHLDDAAPAVGGRAGEQLTNTPRFSIGLTGDYRFPLWSEIEGFVGATLRSETDRTASFDGDPGSPQYRLPGYSLLDLRGGATYRNYKLTIYCKNATDERAQLSAGTGFQVLDNTASVEIARPITVGAVLGAEF